MDPKSAVTYDHLRKQFKPEFTFPKKAYVFDPDLARENLMPKSAPVPHYTVSSPPYVEDEKSFQNVVDRGESIKSAKGLVWWALRLPKGAARAIIHGYREADRAAASGENAVFTTSDCFRDQLVSLMLHAGYSVCFNLAKIAGSIVNIRKGEVLVAKDNMWKLKYASHNVINRPSSGNRMTTAATPGLRVASDVKAKNYDGRTWCVQMPHGFVVVRCAETNGKFFRG